MLFKRGHRWFFRSCFQCNLVDAAPQFNSQAVRLAIISEGLNSWPLYVAQSKRLFQRQGIDVEVTLTGSSAKQLDQLKAGRYDIGFQQSDHVVSGVESGTDLFIFMALSHAPELSLVVAPGVHSFADLKGKDIAVDGARSGYALTLRRLLAEKGLGGGDYAFREIGGSQERYNALKNGVAAASLLNPPFDRNLFAAGFGSLGSTREYLPTYPGSIAAARRSWAKRNEKELIAFIRGFNAAHAWLQDPANKSEAIHILLARLNIDAKMAAKAFDRFVNRPLPSITAEGLRQVIEMVWDAEGLKPPTGAPCKYLDLSYLERAMQAR